MCLCQIVWLNPADRRIRSLDDCIFARPLTRLSILLSLVADE